MFAEALLLVPSGAIFQRCARPGYTSPPVCLDTYLDVVAVNNAEVRVEEARTAA